jgi:hypothetical protein
MPTSTEDNNKRRGPRRVISKEDALHRLGGNDDSKEKSDGFDAGPVNTNIKTEGDEKSSRRTHRPKPKQELLIDDVKPEVHPAVQAAAERYVEVLDERMELMRKEPELRSTLIDLMVHHNVKTLRVNDEELELETIRKIKKKKDKSSE